jgi:membrane associated rhomboid family serine protease
MLITVPYQTDVVPDSQPVANYVLIVITSFCFALFGLATNDVPEWMILYGWSFPGMVGHLFLHADWMHLIGNMLFLFVFGNAVCSRIGNGKYLFLYLSSGVLAGIGHLLFSESPAIGASGAVSAIVGMYFCLFPKSKVSMFYIVFFQGGVFQIRSIWLISFWFLVDLIGSMLGDSDIAYHAHVAGYLVGFFAAFILIKREMVTWYEGEHPLIVPASWKKREEKTIQAPVKVSSQSPGPSKNDHTAHKPVPNAFKPSQTKTGEIKYNNTPEGFQIDCTCGKSFNISQNRWNSLIACPGCFSEYRVSDLIQDINRLQ